MGRFFKGKLTSDATIEKYKIWISKKKDLIQTPQTLEIKLEFRSYSVRTLDFNRKLELTYLTSAPVSLTYTNTVVTSYSRT